MNSEITDVDRYEQTVSPLARDPAVRKVVIDRVTDGLVKKIDVHRVSRALADTLADRDAPRFLVDTARSLDDQLKAGVTTGVRFAVGKVVTSDAFAKAWDSVNRGAHTVATNVLTGEGGGALEIKGDTLTLNVGPVAEEVQRQLIGATLVKAEDIPGADRSIVLARNDNLGAARDGARWLGVVGPWLPLTVVLLGGLGIWVAPSRRVALMAGGIGTGLMMCGLLVGLAVSRQIYLDAVTPAAQSRDAAAAVYDTLVRFLREAALTALLAALFVVSAGYLYGPGRGATAVRSAAAHGTATAGHALARRGVRTGAAGQWLRTHRAATTAVVVGAGGLVLFLWNYPTTTTVAVLALLVVVVLVILGILAAAGAAADASEESDQRLSGEARPRCPSRLRPRPRRPPARSTSAASEQPQVPQFLVQVRPRVPGGGRGAGELGGRVG
ncbi:hypothetical protein [Streptomyces sp. DSM 15324]|uniref:hypothetical protein n=1 Tax=Streptomyces sp. DSM 15324 TaxID=1739111 RepID=UPI000746F228|nr:hypothetical protein [Streptomyces sp. DSM 15324]KUO10515.1 hypothetical protein AQJ58_19145 [Streptomyces sp. DSM 15324]